MQKTKLLVAGATLASLLISPLSAFAADPTTGSQAPSTAAPVVDASNCDKLAQVYAKSDEAGHRAEMRREEKQRDVETKAHEKRMKDDDRMARALQKKTDFLSRPGRRGDKRSAPSEAVKAAVATHQAALDKAQSDFRATTEPALKARQAAVDAAAAARKAAIESAAAKMKANCLAGVPKKQLTSDFKLAVKAAKTTFADAVKAAQSAYKATTQAAQQARQDAIKAANDAFKKSIEAAQSVPATTSTPAPATNQ